MKRAFTIVLLVFAASSLAAAQNATTTKLEQDLRQIHQQLTEAFNRADTTTAERLYADDFILTYREGQRFTKADMIKFIPAPKDVGNFKLTETMTDVAVRDYGDVALLNYVTDFGAQVREKTINYRMRVTDVFRKHNGQWQIVASQATTVPEKILSIGVANGKATSLVQPTYSPEAQAAKATGAVNVSVTIDENGNVVSAKEISGNPIFRAEVEKAAKASKFSPTIVSGEKTKVVGIIVYNFPAK